MPSLMPSLVLSICLSAAPSPEVTLDGPTSAKRFDPAEFVLHVSHPSFTNPFTEVSVSGRFTVAGGGTYQVGGFCDSQDGSVFRLRFCPDKADTAYAYEIKVKGGGLDRSFTGILKCDPSQRPGPVIVDPHHPKHFVYACSGKPFYHLGYTAYHLFDPTNSDEQIDGLISYCRKEGFNKIRFLLSGYPRDTVDRTSHDNEYGVNDPWRAPNYGAKRGEINPLPAWLGEPHHYDFTRFNLPYWQRIDRAVSLMRDAGIVATCIFTIEKQDLPVEYGALTVAEYQFYRYGVDRLAAFDNVWWDLGNEHNEFRDAAWGDKMGAFVKDRDPYDRLASAHGYEEFRYTKSKWADFIIVQQYGDAKSNYDWAMKFYDVPKPFINEEYGYEGDGRHDKNKPLQEGHGQDADAVRRDQWGMAMANGYATYGDWSGGVSCFYMGEVGPGKAASQLKYLRGFFEALPYRELVPHGELCTRGFCLAIPADRYVFYFPKGGQANIDLGTISRGELGARWFDPRTGRWQDGPAVRAGSNRIVTPDDADWVLYVAVASVLDGQK